MQTLVWDSKFSVHVDEMDRQHQVWFQCINDLIEAISSQQGVSALDRVFPEVIRYTEYHFQEEEGFLEKSGYPDLERHRLEHRRFEERMRELYRAYKEEDAPISLAVLEQLVNWLKDHILGTDMRYGEFVKQKGKAS